MNADLAEGWTLDKKINLSNLLTAMVVAISVIWWAAQIEKRVAVLEVELKAFYEAQLQTKAIQVSRDEKQDNEVEQLEKLMREGFDKLHVKLDKLMASR